MKSVPQACGTNLCSRNVCQKFALNATSDTLCSITGELCATSSTLCFTNCICVQNVCQNCINNVYPVDSVYQTFLPETYLDTKLT